MMLKSFPNAILNSRRSVVPMLSGVSFRRLGKFRTLRVVALFITALVALACTSNAADLRLPDDRKKLDPDKLTACGLRIVQSKRLVLVTDVPLEEVRNLPLLADALFDELEKQLGKLPPDLAGTEFQVTGYLIDAKERFEAAGVLPPEEFQFRHGRHIGYQFWMNNQTSAYYRRHLLLHEFVHCFMMCEHGMQDIPPLWYTEGLSEYFATHVLDENIAASRFGILPPAINGFEGWGRINEIRQAITAMSSMPGNASRALTLEELRHPVVNAFRDEDYARGWALVWLIRNHPELKPLFVRFASVRTQQQFADAEREIPAEVWKRLEILWPLCLDSLIEGFDIERSFPKLSPETKPWPVSSSASTKLSIESNQGWQSSGFVLKAGQDVTLSCSGRYVVHDQPRPWISEPQGITIDYHGGRPLGEVVAMLVPLSGGSLPAKIPVGVGTKLANSVDAELWLQINDDASQRAGNSGSVVVEIR